MADILAKLTAALAARYTIERELGRGGMATVYVAHDLRHDRAVAIKVLKPELAQMVGPERFHREIKVAASLNHPNILPLLDSGDAEGLLYYVMPVVEGASLADRLRRETQLGIDTAVSITRQVAEALDHAHAHGIIHRDVKPENILLSGEHAFLTDFGVARLVGGNDGDRLTETGLAVGTPAYMSPEQIGTSGNLDGRTDIYSLGCVLYEMLIGETPFGGPSAQIILARHAVEPVRDMRLVRATVSDALERTVIKAMAKSPADRFSTGKEFATALGAAAARPSWGTARLPRRVVALPKQAPWLVGAGLLLLLLVIGLGAWWRLGRSTVTRLNPELAVVLPFRVSGGTDPGLGALGPQLADQLALRLTGDGGPRAANPGTVMASLKRLQTDSGDVSDRVAQRVLREVRAGLLLRGQLWRDGRKLALGATLLDATGDSVVARVERVDGSPDSLSALVDRLAAELLARAAGSRAEDLPSLLAAPLPALRAYLAGRRAFAHGQFAVAGRRYLEAIDLDSTFVQVALGMVATAKFLPDTALDRGADLAIVGKARLGRADQAYLAALTQEGLVQKNLVLWETAVAAAPDRMERWYGLGEILLHKGPWLGLPDWRERAAAAFRRALDLDPDFVPALGHALDLAAADGDQPAVRDLGARYIARDSVGELAEYYRWRIAVALGDSGFRKEFRAHLDRQTVPSIERLINVAQLDGVAIEDAVASAEVLRRNAGLGNQTRWGYTKLHEIALNRGRPAEAAALIRQRDEAIPPKPIDHLSNVVEALFWGADTVLVHRNVAEGAAMADVAPAREAQDDPALFDVCGVNLWRAAHGDLTRLPAAIQRLRKAAPVGENPAAETPALCANLLELQWMEARKDPALGRKLAEFDGFFQTAPDAPSWILTACNLTIARLLEEQGDVHGALRAVRRRAYITDFREARVLVALSTFLREEGRLAALAGEKEEAVTAYRHYLVLRADPEPSEAGEVEAVREALGKLQ